MDFKTTFFDLHWKHIHLFHSFLQFIFCWRGDWVNIVITSIIVLIGEGTEDLCWSEWNNTKLRTGQSFIVLTQTLCFVIFLGWVRGGVTLLVLQTLTGEGEFHSSFNLYLEK